MWLWGSKAVLYSSMGVLLMNRLGIAVAAAALLTSTSAFAQSAAGPAISSVDTFATTYLYPPTVPSGVEIFGGNDLGSGAGSGSFPGSGFTMPFGSGQWNSFVDTTTNPGSINFQSSNAVGGNNTDVANIKLESVSAVQLGIENGGSLDLHSQITAAGFGFYLASVGDGSCILSGTCAQVGVDTAFSFDDFRSTGASVGFDFVVSANANPDLFCDGVASLCTRELYSVHGSLELNSDGVYLGGLEDAQAKLLGFGLETPPAGGDVPYHSLGYNWRATDFDVTGGLLDAGFQTVTYYTRVYSQMGSPCLSSVTEGTVCLLAYSGFGDPIGLGGDPVQSRSHRRNHRTELLVVHHRRAANRRRHAVCGWRGSRAGDVAVDDHGLRPAWGGPAASARPGPRLILDAG